MRVANSFGESVSRLLRQGGLMSIIVLYTLYSALPFVWLGSMSLRTTPEISAAHFAWRGRCELAWRIGAQL